MPPFGQLDALPVYLDAALAQNETIVFAAGTHTDTMSVRAADFLRLTSPRRGAAPAEGPHAERRRPAAGGGARAHHRAV